MQEQKMIRVLVVTNTPWRMDNGLGNTLTSYFAGADGLELANVYCRSGKPDNCAPITRAFQITERSLIRNLLNPTFPAGSEIFDRDSAAPKTTKGFDVARALRWQILFWARDLIWKIGRWESPELKEFIRDFKPDLLFLPVYYSNYLCDIDMWVKDFCGIPSFTNILDDIYSMHQNSYSPLYWLDRMIKRNKIRRVVDDSEMLYVLSSSLEAEYSDEFSVQIKTLCKGFEFKDVVFEDRHKADVPLKLLYAGNLGSGRWRSLSDIANLVSSINSDELLLLLDIYTPTPLTSKMRKALSGTGVALHGPIPSSEVARLQEESDILIHVESFEKKEKFLVRHSISTKIPDYLYRGGFILAYGPSDVASVEYLRMSNSASVASTREELRHILSELISNPGRMTELRKQAFAFAKANHNRESIQDMLINDFRDAFKKGDITERYSEDA